MLKKGAALAILLASIPSVSRADWQYTKWGMTPDQAVAASNGAMKLATSKQIKDKARPTLGEALAVGFYQTPDLHFEATLHFQHNKLSAVALTPTKDRQMVERQLRATYGKPDSDAKSRATADCLSSTTTWRSQDIVQMSKMDCFYGALNRSMNIMTIIYEPKQDSASTGL